MARVTTRVPILMQPWLNPHLLLYVACPMKVLCRLNVCTVLVCRVLQPM